MADSTPIPPSQQQLSEATRDPLLGQGAPTTINLTARELQRTVKDDPVKKLSIGLRDIDEAIFYYFENVIRPSVIRNGTQVNVPILYGSPERWKAMQADGFYRDKNGKIMTPLIMVKRDTLEKNRNLGNKMDANNPNNFGIFEKKYSRKNVYDKFSVLSNRNETKEYQGVVIPDFVNLTYTCVIFTEYIEQMNKLVESINYASDSYWGDVNKFNFRAMIDSYSTVTEVVKGQDRTVKTNFTIKLLGHVIPDTINTALQGSTKFFSKSRVNFKFETTGNIEELEARARTPEAKASTRFFDSAGGGGGASSSSSGVSLGMTPAEKTYVSSEKLYSSNTITVDVNVVSKTLTWNNITIATPPTGFPALTVGDFRLFINGQLVEKDAITSIVQSGSNVVVTLNSNLDFELSTTDEYSLSGKFA